MHTMYSLLAKQTIKSTHLVSCAKCFYGLRGEFYRDQSTHWYKRKRNCKEDRIIVIVIPIPMDKQSLLIGRCVVADMAVLL